MKKLILISLIIFSSLKSIIAEDDTQIVASMQSSNTNLEINSDDPEPEENYNLYPEKYKSFFLATENQISLMTQLLTAKGKKEVIRYFLSLKKHNNQKAIDVLSNNKNPDLRLVILENLPITVFSEIISSFFSEKGGKAQAHWGYEYSNKCVDIFLTPPSRAQQYINFYMNYKTSIMGYVMASIDPEILQARGKRIAKVLNSFDESTVIDLLYGRPDTQFIDQSGEIVKEKYSYWISIPNSDYSYRETYIDSHGTERQRHLTQYSFQLSSLKKSRVHKEFIDQIIPHLSPNLIIAILAKETETNTNRLPELIKTLGCNKALGELFEYLEDNIKDSVFQVCEDDNALLNILDLSEDTNNQPLLGDGSNRKEL